MQKFFNNDIDLPLIYLELLIFYLLLTDFNFLSYAEK